MRRKQEGKGTRCKVCLDFHPLKTIVGFSFQKDVSLGLKASFDIFIKVVF